MRIWCWWCSILSASGGGRLPVARSGGATAAILVENRRTAIIVLVLNQNGRPSPATSSNRQSSSPLAERNRAPPAPDPHRQGPPWIANADAFRFIEGPANPAVSTSFTGMPPSATVSLTRSRVVPGVAVRWHAHFHQAVEQLDFPR